MFNPFEEKLKLDKQMTEKGMSEENLVSIQRLLSLLTAYPWEVKHGILDGELIPTGISASTGDNVIAVEDGRIIASQADLEFLSAAPEIVQKLLKEAYRARKAEAYWHNTWIDEHYKMLKNSLPEEYGDEDSDTPVREIYALNQYQMWAETTAVFPEENRMKYLFWGLLAEIGEICGVFAKDFRQDFEHQELQQRLIGELGDIFWFLAMLLNTARPQIPLGQMHGVLALLCGYLNINMLDVLETNKQKLETRKRNNTLKGDGEVR